MHSDFLDLLQLLNEHKVEYLVIGGYAVSFYSEPRYTKDIDIWVKASSANGKKIIKALKLFGAPVDNISVDDFVKPGLIYIFGIPPLRVDILNELERVNFDMAYKSRNVVLLGKIKVPFVDLLTLIKTKEIAGRPQDKIDIKNLKKIGK